MLIEYVAKDMHMCLKDAGATATVTVPRAALEAWMRAVDESVENTAVMLSRLNEYERYIDLLILNIRGTGK